MKTMIDIISPELRPHVEASLDAVIDDIAASSSARNRALRRSRSSRIDTGSSTLVGRLLAWLEGPSGPRLLLAPGGLGPEIVRSELWRLERGQVLHVRLTPSQPGACRLALGPSGQIRRVMAEADALLGEEVVLMVKIDEEWADAGHLLVESGGQTAAFGYTVK